jgi:hypothetical protein
MASRRVPARPVLPFACPTSPAARCEVQLPRFHLRVESRSESSIEGCRRTSRRGGCLQAPETGSPFVCHRPGSATIRGYVRSSRGDDRKLEKLEEPVRPAPHRLMSSRDATRVCSSDSWSSCRRCGSVRIASILRFNTGASSGESRMWVNRVGSAISSLSLLPSYMTPSSKPHAPLAASANSRSAYWASNLHLPSDRRLRMTSITVTETKTTEREARIVVVTGWSSQNLLA